MSCLLNTNPLVLLSIDERTTERLSKIWMPLDEFTNTVMDGLKRGDSQIAAGMSKKQYEKYEQDKLSAMISMPGK